MTDTPRVGGGDPVADPLPFADSDTPTTVQVEEPIDVGWYAYSGGRQTMIFHLGETGQWHVYLDNGSAAPCVWGYIEQALGVWDLVPIVLPPASPVLNPPETLQRLVDQWGAESIFDAFITRWPDVDTAGWTPPTSVTLPVRTSE